MIREKLIEYNNLTLQGIKLLTEGMDIEEIINKREEIINIFREQSFKREEFKELIEEIKLFQNEKELYEKIKKEKLKVKEEMEVLKKRKNMKNIYGNVNKRVYFNRTI